MSAPPASVAASTSASAPVPHRPSYALSNAQRYSSPTHPPTSILTDSRFVSPNSLVILFTSRDRTPIPIKVVKGGMFHNAHGAFPHDSIIGRPFGSRILSTNGRGFIIILRPTPELWTTSLPHRTQILYAADIAFILLKLGVGPGSRVVEAGTGSGSFTHSVARSVARGEQWKGGRGWKGDGKERGGRDARDGGAQRADKRQKLDAKGTAATTEPRDEAGDGQEDEEEEDEETARKILSSPCDEDVDPRHGRVWSFEFNEVRARKARSEFRAHNLSSIVSLRHRNVCKDGFGLTNSAEAVFLDLPSPWEAIPHLSSTLRADISTRVCCFSPCIEQVLKTASSLRQAGFVDVETFESLVRTHESLTQDYVAPLQGIEKVMGRLRRNERFKLSRREKQIENSRRRNGRVVGGKGGGGAGEEGERDKNEEEDEEEDEAMDEGDIVDAGKETSQPQELPQESNKRESLGAHQEIQEDLDSPPILIPTGRKHFAPSSSSSAANGTSTPNQGGRQGQGEATGGAGKEGFKLVSLANIYSRTFPDMRGHTSYLTFATLLPRQPGTGSEDEGTGTGTGQDEAETKAEREVKSEEKTEVEVDAEREVEGKEEVKEGME